MHTSSESACASAASSRRAEANRANAQKSTGPKSEAGKSRSSRNATRHGLLAQVSTLLEKPNRELETLIEKYRSEFLPSSTHEEMLVGELAVSDWRLKQNARIEAGLLSVEMHAVYTSIVNMERTPRWPEEPRMACPQCGDVHREEALDEPDPEQPQLSDAGDDIRTALMGAAWANDPAAFALLVRYQSQARRDYFRALKQLELVRTGKVGYLPEKPPSRMGKPVEPEAPIAANETNPTAAPYKTAAASSAGNHSSPNGSSVLPDAKGRPVNAQTNPNIACFIPKWENPNAPYIATSEEWRQIFGARDENLDFTKAK